jgi:methenyltetrahydromethanopterin cyclohydrolase
MCERRVINMGELKSAWELAMEKTKKMGGEDAVTLTADQKQEIAEIRKKYEAKIAEAEIIITDPEKKEKELDYLRRERERKIEGVYEKVQKKK